jgi:hypothetical protein
MGAALAPTTVRSSPTDGARVAAAKRRGAKPALASTDVTVAVPSAASVSTSAGAATAVALGTSRSGSTMLRTPSATGELPPAPGASPPTSSTRASPSPGRT